MSSYLRGFLSAVALIMLCSFSEEFFPKRNASILKDGVEFYGVRKDVALLPFTYNGKIGFTNKSGKLEIRITPMFDDMEFTTFALVPVKMNGKWGAVDVSGNTGSNMQPIIPCVYDMVEALDDEHIIAVNNGVSTKLDIKDFR